MPIVSITSQPLTDSLNAAYRPIALTARAKRTDNTSTPPVVYCDIYINTIFYKTIAKSQPQTINVSDSDWFFDVQDACQEVFDKPISPNGGSAFYVTNSIFASVFCKFRSSGFDSDGFIVPENTAPIQGTGLNPPVSGTGTQSHTFFVVNSVLQHVDNPDLATHLDSYKVGTWDTTTYPLTHRTDNYRVCPTASDYFPIFRMSPPPDCIRLYYKYRGDSSYTVRTTCGIPIIGIGTGICSAINIVTTSIPDAYNGVAYVADVLFTGTQPVTITNIVKPSWMTVTLNNSLSRVELRGTPSSTGSSIAVKFDLNNCTSDIDSFVDRIDILSTAPTINLASTASCRSTGTCNDNAVCGVRYSVVVANAPAGSYIALDNITGTASITVYDSNPAHGYLSYQESNGLESVTFDLLLKDSGGATIASQVAVTISHDSPGSPWNLLSTCSQILICVVPNNEIEGQLIWVKATVASGVTSVNVAVGFTITTQYGSYSGTRTILAGHTESTNAKLLYNVGVNPPDEHMISFTRDSFTPTTDPSGATFVDCF